MPDIASPVLIVGGSLVGMSAALFLGYHGIRSTVVEHHRGTAIHPRAAMVTQRSMEAFRTGGIEQVFRFHVSGADVKFEETSPRLLQGRFEGICLSPDGAFVCAPAGGWRNGPVAIGKATPPSAERHCGHG